MQAPIDTGSMRSFIRTDIYNIIDYDHLQIKNTDSERCASITGHSLKIEGMASAGVRLIRSKYIYEGNFLISSSIPCD